MTKKEWSSIRQDTRVWTKNYKYEEIDGKFISKTIFTTGVVKRINLNGSQVLVDWGGHDNWHGRLSIDLMATFPKEI